MTRSAHTYRLGDVEVVLTVPEGIRVPRVLALKRTADAADAVFEHVGVKAVRAPAKRKPQQARPLAKIAEDWLPPEGEADKAQAKCPSVNIEFETAQFVDWAISKGEKRADWLAAWRGWIRRTHQRNVEQGWKPSQVAKPSADESALERWCRRRGITVAEFERRKDEPGWLDRMKQQGIA